MNADLIVENISRICKLKGIPPTTACIESGAGKNLIGHIRSGRKPSVERIGLLADYLGVTTSELLGENKKPPSSEDEERLKKVLANVSEETREAMALLDQLNPENLERAKEYIRFELARQASAEGKK